MSKTDSKSYVPDETEDSLNGTTISAGKGKIIITEEEVATLTARPINCITKDLLLKKLLEATNPGSRIVKVSPDLSIDLNNLEFLSKFDSYLQNQVITSSVYTHALAKIVDLGENPSAEEVSTLISKYVDYAHENGFFFTPQIINVFSENLDIDFYPGEQPKSFLVWQEALGKLTINSFDKSTPLLSFKPKSAPRLNSIEYLKDRHIFITKLVSPEEIAHQFSIECQLAKFRAAEYNQILIGCPRGTDDTSLIFYAGCNKHGKEPKTLVLDYMGYAHNADIIGFDARYPAFWKKIGEFFKDHQNQIKSVRDHTHAVFDSGSINYHNMVDKEKSLYEVAKMLKTTILTEDGQIVTHTDTPISPKYFTEYEPSLQFAWSERENEIIMTVLASGLSDEEVLVSQELQRRNYRDIDLVTICSKIQHEDAFGVLNFIHTNGLNARQVIEALNGVSSTLSVEQIIDILINSCDFPIEETYEITYPFQKVTLPTIKDPKAFIQAVKLDQQEERVNEQLLELIFASIPDALKIVEITPQVSLDFSNLTAFREFIGIISTGLHEKSAFLELNHEFELFNRSAYSPIATRLASLDIESTSSENITKMISEYSASLIEQNSFFDKNRLINYFEKLFLTELQVQLALNDGQSIDEVINVEDLSVTMSYISLEDSWQTSGVPARTIEAGIKTGFIKTPLKGQDVLTKFQEAYPLDKEEPDPISGQIIFSDLLEEDFFKMHELNREYNFSVKLLHKILTSIPAIKAKDIIDFIYQAAPTPKQSEALLGLASSSESFPELLENLIHYAHSINITGDGAISVVF